VDVLVGICMFYTMYMCYCKFLLL